eukprot:365129-Chlamydomonas_euryale.AAC.5
MGAPMYERAPMYGSSPMCMFQRAQSLWSSAGLGSKAGPDSKATAFNFLGSEPQPDSKARTSNLLGSTPSRAPHSAAVTRCCSCNQAPPTYPGAPADVDSRRHPGWSVWRGHVAAGRPGDMGGSFPAAARRDGGIRAVAWARHARIDAAPFQGRACLVDEHRAGCCVFLCPCRRRGTCPNMFVCRG